MIDNHRRQWLSAQYVDAIASDWEWYKQAYPWASVNEFRRFRPLTEPFIRDVHILIKGDPLTTEDRAYILLELWRYLEGFEQCCIDSPGVYGYHFKELLTRSAIQSKSENPKPTAQNTNPCNEILLEVAGHCALANEHLDRVATNIENITKEKSMTINTNPNTAIETRTVIFGRDSNDLTEQDLIDAIKKVEGEIAKLKEVKTSSKKIAANIKTLEEQLDAIVAVLDAR